jgi:2-oxoglutarate ferredoxin oxidoreductase subunit beta
MLHRAAAHKGTSFIEIVQNCPVFNDGAFDAYTDKATKDDNRMLVEHGKPLLFGADLRRGIRLRADLSFEIVSLDNVDISAIAVHDETNPVMTQLLARLGHGPTPLPLGVLRCVDGPGASIYEETVLAQIEEARASRGAPDFDKLYRSGETWTVS